MTKRDYVYLDFSMNLDAYYYTQVCPSVTITDEATRKYITENYFSNPRPCLYLDGLRQFVNNFPDTVSGRFHQSNKKVIDFWEVIDPGAVQCLKAVVSQRFIDVLDQVGVNPDEYFIKEIAITNNKSGLKYYMFFVPRLTEDHIVYKESVFAALLKSISPKTMMFESENDKKEHGQYYSLKDAVLKYDSGFLDVLLPPGCVRFFVSERLFNALEAASIKGYRVTSEKTLKVISE